MADPIADDTESNGRRTRPVPTGMPRWVKVFVIIGLLLIALLVSSLLIGGGGHGPGRHGSGTETPTSTEDGHTPPVDHGP